jgi:hypothetical protein
LSIIVVTITRFSNNYYEGLTADVKPTNVPAGATFRDTQLDIYYEYNGSSWDIIIGNTKTETLSNKTILDSGSNQIGVHIPYTFTIYQDVSNYIVRNNHTGALQTFTNTDFAPALEWAIDNIVNVGLGTQSSLYGGGIFIQRGKYVATTTINPDIDTATRHSIIIQGEGFGTEINFNPAGATTDGFLIDLAAFSLRDMRITANDQITNIVHLIGHGSAQRRNDYNHYENLMVEGPNGNGGWVSDPHITNQIGILMDGASSSNFFSIIRGCKFHSLEKGIWFKGTQTTSCFCTDNMSMCCEIGIEVSDTAGQLIIDGFWAQGDTFDGTTGIKVTTGAGGYIYIDHVVSEMHREVSGSPVASQAVLIESGVGNVFVGKSISNSKIGDDPLYQVIVDNATANLNHTPWKWNYIDKNFITLDYASNLINVNASRKLVLKTSSFLLSDTGNDHNWILVAAGDLAASRNITLPILTANDTFVFAAHTQTLTNKTLTSPVISTISNTGTLTLPTSTDTLVGRATTDTLTNKTLTSPIINSPTLTNSGNTLTLPTTTDTLVGRDTTDTLTNKTISGSSNTLSNIPDGALSANVPLLNTANVFTAAQKVSLNSETVLTAHRTSNTINTDSVAIDLSMNNSSSAETVISSIKTLMNSNTAGSETGQLEFYVKSSGVMARRFLVNSAGTAFIGTNARLRLTETGLTGNCIMTFPNSDQTLVGRTDAATLTNKTIGTTGLIIASVAAASIATPSAGFVNLFFNTTDSKLSIKDSAGTTTPLH